MRRKYHDIKKAAALLLIFAMALTAGCGKKEKPRGVLGEDGLVQFVIAAPEGEISLDPSECTGWAREIAGLVFCSLFSADDYGLPQMSFLTAYTYDRDTLTFSGTVRSGAVFSDGTPLTARDAAASIIAMTDSVSYFSLLDFVDAGTVQALDDTHITFRTRWYNVLFDYDLAQVPIFSASDGSRASGPYMVESADDNGVSIVRNPNWYGAFAGGVERYIFRKYAPGDAVEAVASGEADGAFGLPPDAFGTLSDAEGISCVSAPTENVSILSFNVYDDDCAGACREAGIGYDTSNPCVKDIAVRYAVDLCADRDAIAEEAYSGQARPALGFMDGEGVLRISLTGAPFLRTGGYEEAARILGSAGYADTDGDGVVESPDGVPVRLRLIVAEDNAEGVKSAGIIRGNCALAGIAVEVTALDKSALLRRELTMDFDMALWSAGGERDLSAAYCRLFRYDGMAGTYCYGYGWNDSGYNSADFADSPFRTLDYGGYDFDGLDVLQKGAATKDTRREYLYRMAAMVYEDCPALALCCEYTVQAVNGARWTGFDRIPAGGRYFRCSSPVNYTSMTPLNARG